MKDFLLPGDDNKTFKKMLRRGFVKKVLGIVSAQFFFTTLVVYLIVSSQSTIDYLKNNISILIVFLCIYVITAIFLICCRNLARKVPANYILLALFTSSLSIIVASSASLYELTSIVNAFVITFVTCVAITFYALFSKVKINFLVGAIFVVFSSLATTGILLIFGVGSYNWYYFLVSVLFGLFLLFDIKRVSSSKYGLSHEDYIYGAMMIYLDIINLFLWILKLVGNRK